MRGRAGRAFARIRKPGRLRWSATLALLALGLAGCQTTGNGGPAAALPSGASPTIAFESIDGAPDAVFRKLVRKLNEEAEKRQVPVVTREGFAPYRIRGYVALGIEKKRKRTLISWVWDVYDAGERRAVRLTGEEVGKAAGRDDAWAVADDEMLSRIARNGIEQLAAYLHSPAANAPVQTPAPDSPAQPDDRGYAVASTDDFRPEASGIFRLFRSEAAPETPAPSEASADLPPPGDVPLPRRRPAKAGQPAHVAYASPDR